MKKRKGKQWMAEKNYIIRWSVSKSGQIYCVIYKVEREQSSVRGRREGRKRVKSRKKRSDHCENIFWSK